MKPTAIIGTRDPLRPLPVFIQKDLCHDVIWPEDEITELTTQPVVEQEEDSLEWTGSWQENFRQWCLIGITKCANAIYTPPPLRRA